MHLKFPNRITEEDLDFLHAAEVIFRDYNGRDCKGSDFMLRGAFKGASV